ncbi:MAG: TrmB family transcriptional regulator [Chloroflexi bacterium HGW-Chloroflexi-1]|nr:MAG: TrmB family transcriptional regulator [Chloroflexi bacterium HGW-Chloroflexi-1]
MIATIKELEIAMSVTATAVRQQLTGLMADGYVDQEVQRTGRGRPRHVYSLTAEGRALSPKHYDEFTNSLLREILVSEGPQKVRSLLGRMGQRLAEQYRRQIANSTLEDRAVKLTELLNARGILAEVHVGPGGILVHEYTCPYYELAREHRAICDMEQDMIAQVMQQPVELVACTLDGHHGCQFRIEPVMSNE